MGVEYRCKRCANRWGDSEFPGNRGDCPRCYPKRAFGPRHSAEIEIDWDLSQPDNAAHHFIQTLSAGGLSPDSVKVVEITRRKGHISLKLVAPSHVCPGSGGVGEED